MKDGSIPEYDTEGSGRYDGDGRPGRDARLSVSSLPYVGIMQVPFTLNDALRSLILNDVQARDGAARSNWVPAVKPTRDRRTRQSPTADTEEIEV